LKLLSTIKPIQQGKESRKFQKHQKIPKARKVFKKIKKVPKSTKIYQKKKNQKESKELPHSTIYQI
jgi:hypothetical protein